MHKITVFTQHGIDRIARTGLTREAVTSILDNPLKYVLIRRERGTNLIHKLFFSVAAKCCFVVVQDRETGEVVTILSLPYYRWEVPLDAQVYARRRIYSDPEKEPHFRSATPRSCIITVRGTFLLPERPQYPHFVHRKLGKIGLRDFDCDFEDLPHSIAAKRFFLAQAQKQRLASRVTCVGLIFSLGQLRAYSDLRGYEPRQPPPCD